MTRELKTMDELFAEDEAKRLADGKKQIAAEDAAYHALPQAEKDRLQAERDAHWARIADAEEAAGDDDETDDDEEEEQCK